MKKYTLEDFGNFEKTIGGRILCPSGDYSDIEEFPARCSFGECCKFGKCCSFDVWCSFGKDCRFGEGCSFGKGCSFGEGCSFGVWCSFGKDCRFGNVCSFGKCCSFDVWCSFGKGCSFGDSCIVEADKQLKQYAKIEGAGTERRCTYFFLLTDDRIYVRCGCFAGYEDEFVEKVKETHGGTIYEKQYLLALEFAKSTFEED